MLAGVFFFVRRLMNRQQAVNIKKKLKLTVLHQAEAKGIMLDFLGFRLRQHL